MNLNDFSADVISYGSFPKVPLFGNNIDRLIENESSLDSNFLNANYDFLSTPYQQLKNSINKKESNWIFGKIRENEKIRLDTERQYLLLDRIESFISFINGIVELSATQIFSPKKVELIVRKRYGELINEMEKMQRKHDMEISYYERKKHENDLSVEQLRNDIYYMKSDGESSINQKNKQNDLCDLLIQKIKSTKLQDIPSDSLGMILDFFKPNSEVNGTKVSELLKVINDAKKSDADAYRSYSEGNSKMADAEAKTLENLIKMENFKKNRRDNY
jgi:hypothetical protein